jgi:hypothetical protein
MMPFALAATLIGVVIGQRFTMAALIPTMAFTLVIAGTMRIIDGAAFGATMTDLATSPDLSSDWLLRRGWHYHAVYARKWRGTSGTGIPEVPLGLTGRQPNVPQRAEQQIRCSHPAASPSEALRCIDSFNRTFAE